MVSLSAKLTILLLALVSVPVFHQPISAVESRQIVPQTAQSGPSPEGNTSPASSADSTKLEPIKTQKADYPHEAREKQIQGQVVVKILVSETGDVESAEIVSGDPILAKAAVDAAKQWKFKPFIKDGRPIKTTAQLPFNFAFSDNVETRKVPPADGNDASGRTSAADGAPDQVHAAQKFTPGVLEYKVQPVYPPQARKARIQGTVVLQAKISKEGRVVDLQFVSGPKELVAAAIGAVQQWRYSPYLVAGEAVEVTTHITVNFQLH
jgi:TonB family protein